MNQSVQRLDPRPEPKSCHRFLPARIAIMRMVHLSMTHARGVAGFKKTCSSPPLTMTDADLKIGWMKQDGGKDRLPRC